MDKKAKFFVIMGVVLFFLFTIISEMPYETQEFIGKITSTDYARITDVECELIRAVIND